MVIAFGAAGLLRILKARRVLSRRRLGSTGPARIWQRLARLVGSLGWAGQVAEVAPVALLVVQGVAEEVAGLGFGVEGEGAGVAVAAAAEGFDGPGGGGLAGEADVAAGEPAVAAVPP